MKLNITYIVSDVDRAVAFEWIALGLNKEKFNISFILLNTKPSYLQEFLEKQNIPTYFIQYRGKKTAFKALFKTINYLRSQKTQIVHCHLFNACIIGLTAAKLIGVKKRIYTRHHSTYHHSFYPKAVKWDRYCNYLSTEIISISKTVTETLVDKENVRRLKIHEIYHGFNVFVHTPIDDHSEAFGQVYVEALAAGIPSIFSLSGIANEFIKNNSNALVVPYKNSEAITAGITKILENKLLAQEIADNG